VEEIADLLSSKGQGLAAQQLRELAAHDRGPPRKESLLKLWLGRRPGRYIKEELPSAWNERKK
jgi:hypothetical protein